MPPGCRRAAARARRSGAAELQLHAVRARRAQQPLRVHTDNFDQPFDLNEGASSTSARPPSCARWSPIWNWWRRCTALGRPVGRGIGRAEDQQPRPAEPWAADHLARAAAGAAGGDARCGDGAAASRRAPTRASSPAAGVHHFENFERRRRSPHDGRAVESLRDSVNLVFIRLMRDVVHYVMAAAKARRALLDDPRPSAAPVVPGALRRQGRARVHRALPPQVRRQVGAGVPRTCWCTACGRRRRAWRGVPPVSSRTPSLRRLGDFIADACPTPISPAQRCRRCATSSARRWSWPTAATWPASTRWS